MFKVISLLWVSSFLKFIVFLFLTFGHLIHKILLANFMLECSEKKKKGKNEKYVYVIRQPGSPYREKLCPGSWVTPEAVR